MPAAGDPILIADFLKVMRASSDRPLVRCVSSAAQSIPDNATTALQFASEQIDTHGFHDPVTNNSRITPNIGVAAYYRFTGFYCSQALAAPVSFHTWFRKNAGSEIAPGPRVNGLTLTSGLLVTAIIECNGTSDYVQLMCAQDSAGAVNTSASGQLACVLECELVRYV